MVYAMIPPSRPRAGAVSLAALFLLIAFAGGCANPWRDSFERNPDVPPGSISALQAPPEIRQVEFERLQRFSEAERQRRIESTTAPADLSAQDKTAAKNRLLEALQLPWRGDEAAVIGSSQFTVAEQLQPQTDKRLRDFAQKIGADVVVLSSAYLGKTERFTQVPVTSYTRDTITYSYDRRGRRVPLTTMYDSSSTTWVPMHVVEDQFVYHAFFIRRREGSAAGGS